MMVEKGKTQCTTQGIIKHQYNMKQILFTIIFLLEITLAGHTQPVTYMSNALGCNDQLLPITTYITFSDKQIDTYDNTTKINVTYIVLDYDSKKTSEGEILTIKAVTQGHDEIIWIRVVQYHSGIYMSIDKKINYYNLVRIK